MTDEPIRRSELSDAVDALQVVGVGVANLVANLTAVVSSKADDEARRVVTLATARRRFLIQMTALVFIGFLMVLASITIGVTQMRASDDRNARSNVAIESNRIAADRVQCVESLTANWEAKFGNVVAIGGLTTPATAENQHVFDEFAAANRLIEQYRQICYDPDDPDIDPVH